MRRLACSFILVAALAGCDQGNANNCPSDTPLACAGTGECCPADAPIYCGGQCWNVYPKTCTDTITICNAPSDPSPCESGSYCYEWVCFGDSECETTNPNGTNFGADDEGNDLSCEGLITFGEHFWNIPPAWQSCTLIP